MPDQLIIGAGPAGLTAAYELSKRGEKALLLEADHQVGGISRTVNYQGFRFDIGGHRFFTKADYIRQIWNEILANDFLERPRLSRIYYDHKFFDYPLKMGNTLANLGALESFLVGLSYLKTKMQPQLEERNFEQWVINRFGERLYRIFFKTYTEKVWGIPCREISADWAAQRIRNLSLTTALRNAISSNGHDNNGEIITTLIERFHYPRLGPGMMWEACAGKLARNGSETLLDNRVERICHRNGRVASIVARTSRGECVDFSVDHLISTMPLRELISALDPEPPAAVLEAAAKLRYRDYLTVVLIVDRKETFPDNWIYIHAPEVKLGRVQNYKNWSPEMVPDPNCTSLGLEYFLWEKDEEWRWPDDRLIELGIRESEKIGLLNRSEVRDGTVVRMKKAYPVYDQNYQKALAELRTYLATFDNLQTIGRNGLHRYNNQDHSMLTGVLAARNVLGENHDVWSVNTEQSYHETADRADHKQESRLYPVALPENEIEKQLEETLAPLDATALGLAVGTVAAGLLAFATIWVLLTAGYLKPTFELLGQFFIGYRVDWPGMVAGALEIGLLGFWVGVVLAKLRNWGLSMYLSFLKYVAD